jgi:hypothetical protein
MRKIIASTALLLSTPLAAQDGYAPFGRDPSDPVSSFALRDKAGNEQHHLVRPAPAPGRIEAERCMPKTRLCFSINERDEQGRPLLRVRVFGGSSDRSLPLDLTTGDAAGLAVWSLAIRRAPHEEADAVGESMIVGVEATQRLVYSGGAAHTTVLWLYRIDNAGTANAFAQQLLSVPFDAERSIRACFNEEDEKRRHHACLDQTSVKAMLVLDADNAEPMPRLIYHVATGSYPSDMPFRAPEELPERLAKSDLVDYRHPVCSYDRKLAWNPATARYEFDRPAPDCHLFGLER